MLRASTPGVLALRRQIRGKLGKALFERTSLSLRIPDEVRDAERREFFAGVPGRQAVHRPSAFVFPDALPNLKGLSSGKLDSLSGTDGHSYDKKGQEEPHAYL